MAIKYLKYALALFVLINSWNTVRTAPKPQFNIDFNGSIDTNHNNDCKVAGSCSFGGGNSRPGVTTTNTHVNGPATFDTDFNGSVNNAHISNCQQDGSCRFGGKKKKRSINSTNMLSRGKRNAQFNIKFHGDVGSHQSNDCAYPGACTDQTLASGQPGQIGMGQMGDQMSNDNNGGINQTPNNQTPNNQTPNNQTPNNQYPNNQYPNNGAVTSSSNNGGSHNGFDISMNGAVGSTHHNDCNHAGACTDQTLANGGLVNSGQGTTVIGFTGDQEVVQTYPNNHTPNNQYPNSQYPNNGAVTSSGNNGLSHNGFDISMNGVVGSTHHNDCNHAGACTDQTLANGGLGNSGQGTTVIGFTGDQQIVTQQIH